MSHFKELAEARPESDVAKPANDVPYANPDILVLPKRKDAGSPEELFSAKHLEAAKPMIDIAKEQQLPVSDRFVGNPGDSLCRVDVRTKFGPSVSEKLESMGIKGIQYKNGFPDFSPIAVERVQISEMTSDRSGPRGNFAQAYEAVANKWNAESREGRNDWTPSDVKSWKTANQLDIHECEDGKTCEFVDHETHLHFSHLGGVGIAKMLEKLDGIGINSSQPKGGAFNDQFDA